MNNPKDHRIELYRSFVGYLREERYFSGIHSNRPVGMYKQTLWYIYTEEGNTKLKFPKSIAHFTKYLFGNAMETTPIAF